jgi:DNA-binding NtrC family response regulator
LNLAYARGAISVTSQPEVKLFHMHDCPTVLVAHHDVGVRGILLDCLQQNGFHVLEADDWAHVFHWVRVHSRPIHLVLADVRMDAHVPILKKHRSELQVVFVKKPVDADDVLAKVRQLLGSLPPFSSSIR